jgi:hypothetical protein
LAIACGGHYGEQKREAAMAIVNMRAGMRFGVGLEGWTEEVRGEALEFEDIRDSQGGQHVDSGVSLIESQEALMESLNISVNASVRYGLASVDAKMEFAESHAVNSYTLYLLLRASVTNPPRYMVNPRLSEPAERVYKRDPEEFRRIYGDVFIDEIYSGGDFYGLFIFETRDERSKQDLGGELHASVGGFLAGGEISASFKSTLETFKGQTNMSIKVLRSGGSGVENPTSLDELKELYRHFNAGARDHPVDFRASLKEFRYLPLPRGRSWVETVVRQDTIETCGRYVIDALKTRSAIDFVLKYPDQFESPDLEALRQQRTALNERLPRWARRASACSNDVNECKITPEEAPPPGPALPARKLSSDPLEAKWEDIKHHDDRADEYFSETFLEGTLRDDYQRSVSREGGRYKLFKRGADPIAGLFWHPDVGAFAVYGLIFKEYLRRDHCDGPLGFPTSDEEPYGDGDRVSSFEHGLLWWERATGEISSEPKLLILVPPPGL